MVCPPTGPSGIELSEKTKQNTKRVRTCKFDRMLVWKIKLMYMLMLRKEVVNCQGERKWWTDRKWWSVSENRSGGPSGRKEVVVPQGERKW